MKSSVYFQTPTFLDGSGKEWIDYDGLSTSAAKEFLDLFVGPVIGRGSTRTVFECAHDPSLVIKISNGYTTQNPVEYRTWQTFKDDARISKWLAPVVAISGNGRIIMQRRTKPMLKPPAKIPNFLGDLKIQNFGMLDGKVVAHDYGMGIYIDTDHTITMVPPKWWDGKTGDYL